MRNMAYLNLVTLLLISATSVSVFNDSVEDKNGGLDTMRVETRPVGTL